jgi:hypothetical protein
LNARALTLDDISDLRAYEREREEFRAHVIKLKKRRRVSVGPFVTLVFENAVTIRFQIQEMARAEKIISDEGIRTELRIYNPLIPEPGNLSATMFLELTTPDQLREWLPRFVGVERAVVLRFGGHEVRCSPDADHEANLTRQDVTSAVHYLTFELSDAEVADFTAGPAELLLDHPEYKYSVTLSGETVAELGSDLHAE